MLENSDNFEKYVTRYVYMAYILNISEELKKQISSEVFFQNIQRTAFLNVLKMLKKSDYSELKNNNDYKIIIKKMLSNELTNVYTEASKLYLSKQERINLAKILIKAKKLLFEYENMQQNENFSCNDEKSTNSEQECKENSTPIENAIDIITSIMTVIVFVSLCFIIGKNWSWSDNFLLALLLFPLPVIIGTAFVSAPILFIGLVLKKVLNFIIDKVVD